MYKLFIFIHIFYTPLFFRSESKFLHKKQQSPLTNIASTIYNPAFF